MITVGLTDYNKMNGSIPEPKNFNEKRCINKSIKRVRFRGFLTEFEVFKAVLVFFNSFYQNAVF
jgi:hypothetical protein